MARDLTTAFKNAIIADVVIPALLVSAEFDEGTVNLWSGYGDFTWDSKTFTGAGDFGGISEVEETENIQANGVVFTLSGIPSSLLSVALAYQYQGRPIRCWLAAFDASTNALIADPYQLFAGRMDIMTINEGSDTATIGLSAESLLIDLQRPRNRRYTNEDQLEEYAGDVFFEYVVSLVERDVTWGVNTAKSGTSSTGSGYTAPNGRTAF